MTPEQFTTFIAGERRKWQEVVQASGVDGAVRHAAHRARCSPANELTDTARRAVTS